MFDCYEKVTTDSNWKRLFIKLSEALSANWQLADILTTKIGITDHQYKDDNACLRSFLRYNMKI